MVGDYHAHLHKKKKLNEVLRSREQLMAELQKVEGVQDKFAVKRGTFTELTNQLHEAQVFSSLLSWISKEKIHLGQAENTELQDQVNKLKRDYETIVPQYDAARTEKEEMQNRLTVAQVTFLKW